jgi:serine/threonine-protein kinase
MVEKLKQDLHDARVLIEQSGTPEETRRYRKAAEIILVKALHGNPGSEEAKALLQCARAQQGSVTVADTPRPIMQIPVAAAVAVPASQPAAQPLAFSSSTVSAPSTVSFPAAAAKFDDELVFTAAGTLFDDSRKKENKKSKLKSMLPFGLIAIVIFGGGFRLLRSRPADQVPPAYAAPANSRTEVASRPVPQALPAAVQQPEPVSVPPRTQTAAIGVLPQSTLPRVTTPAVSVTAATEDKPKELAPPPPPPPPARISVQINAKPWAQVYVDGPVQRRSLGQTPLSGVSVPVGAVLVFENPNFPTKTHRIREADTAIQVEFP